MTTEEILNIKFKSSDLDRRLTVRAYFIELLEELWVEEEGFSGKRPFGNSDWKHDLQKALIKAKAVEGELDSDGYVSEIDEGAFDLAMVNAIHAL